eukprot:CAMPEP_0176498606 /NCGR_PEP_ID=MMETSP0200_2-20121128/12420_1 /TAXON_ID=947934 /ORGANISM="Chaetoceros sp., Strain GSL56" /LENGTH=351 /DNA_ID=CAMNT_0017896843 /DNA_START=70 /DNA_END=1122 /DNA_ORIENTATION=+
MHSNKRSLFRVLFIAVGFTLNFIFAFDVTTNPRISSTRLSFVSPNQQSIRPYPITITGPSTLPRSNILVSSSLALSSKPLLEESNCPVTKFGNKITKDLAWFDKTILSRIIKVANHAPALLSLIYFGVVSMASMMGMGPMTPNSEATLSSVLTRTVGPTSNAAFAALFPTLVTPASFVFLVWPLISLLQLITLSISALLPGKEEILTQDDLTALTLANLCSSAWLFASSNAQPGKLPLASSLILPLVPIFSGYTLRSEPNYILWANQIYCSFTTLASILAFTVEVQYGGRLPLVGKVGPELAGIVFLGLYSLSSLAVAKKTGAKRFVNFTALSGILYKRIFDALGAGTGLW